MKNILIVTYYFEPYNIIATRRPGSWAKYLSKDFNVTVLTRSWTGNENGLNDIAIQNENNSIEEVNGQLQIVRIPYMHFLIPQKKKSRFRKKISGYYQHYFGKFRDIDFINENFEKPLLDILQQKKIDIIIYSCNPYQFLPLAKKTFENTGIKYVIDFRDVIAVTMLKINPSTKEKLYQLIMSYRLRKLLKTAAALITVSDPLKKILSRSFNGPVFTIYNGFDEDTFKTSGEVSLNNKQFEITYTGNLSPEMDLQVILKGAAIFFNECKPAAVINFVGISEKYRIELEKYGSQVNLKFFNWMPHQETLAFTQRASVLIYMGWQGYTGILSGKIFDYLGAQKTILLAPSDNDVIEELLRYTNAGVAENSEQKVAEILSNLYREWQIKGKVNYKGDDLRIKEFTRENQAKLLPDIINNIV